MLINSMSEKDFNCRGSEDIVNKGDPHCQEHDAAKSTSNLQKNTISGTGSHRMHMNVRKYREGNITEPLSKKASYKRSYED